MIYWRPKAVEQSEQEQMHQWYLMIAPGQPLPVGLSWSSPVGGYSRGVTSSPLKMAPTLLLWVCVPLTCRCEACACSFSKGIQVMVGGWHQTRAEPLLYAIRWALLLWPLTSERNGLWEHAMSCWRSSVLAVAGAVDTICSFLGGYLVLIIHEWVSTRGERYPR